MAAPNLGFALGGEDDSMISGLPSPLDRFTEYEINIHDGLTGEAQLLLDLDEVRVVWDALGAFLDYVGDREALSEEARAYEAPLTPTSDLFPFDGSSLTVQWGDFTLDETTLALLDSMAAGLGTFSVDVNGVAVRYPEAQLAADLGVKPEHVEAVLYEGRYQREEEIEREPELQQQEAHCPICAEGARGIDYSGLLTDRLTPSYPGRAA